MLSYLEKMKAQRILDKMDKIFRGKLEQWNDHPNPEWRRKTFQLAETYADKLESATKILALKRQESAI
jgi:hypothetical protein